MRLLLLGEAWDWWRQTPLPVLIMYQSEQFVRPGATKNDARRKTRIT